MRPMRIAAVVTACLMAFAAQAYQQTVDGITWTYTVNNGYASVESGSELSAAIPTETSGALTIPSNLGGFTVVGIGDYAFWDCSGLTSVTIPNSVTSIGDNAFSGCRMVREATVPGWECDMPFGSVTNLVISEGTTNVVNGAFSGCSGLVRVTIPDGVTSIGDDAFYGCNGLTSVVIPASVTSIGDSAFYGCSNLTSVTIPSSVTNIGSSAFSACNALRNVTVSQYVCDQGLSLVFPTIYQSITSATLGDDVTSISDSAFSGCSCLTSLTIQGSVTNSGASAFSACNALKDVKILQYASNRGLSSDFPSLYQSITSVIIRDGVTDIGDCMFAGCSGLTSVTIPSSVTNIANGAFEGCSGIREVYVGYATDEIGWMAKTFPDSYASITNVVLGDEIAVVGDAFFRGCESLNSVTLPAGLSEIVCDAFSGCSNLQTVVWRPSETWTPDVVKQRLVMRITMLDDNWVKSSTDILNSAEIGDSATTSTRAKAVVVEDCEFSFKWSVRSEEGHDFLRFYVDGELKEEISGTVYYYSVSVPLSAGEHILTWSYEKDASGRYGYDRGWVRPFPKEMRGGNVPEHFGGLFADARDSLKDIVLAEGWTSFSDRLLDGLLAVESVTIPSALEDFGDNDFRGVGEAGGKEGLWIESGWVVGYIGTATGTVTIPEGVKGVAA